MKNSKKCRDLLLAIWTQIETVFQSKVVSTDAEKSAFLCSLAFFLIAIALACAVWKFLVIVLLSGAVFIGVRSILKSIDQEVVDHE
jgi:hypothetical protein